MSKFILQCINIHCQTHTMSSICAFLFILSIFSTPFFGVGDDVVDGKVQTFIVRVQNSFKPSTFDGVLEWYQHTLSSSGFVLNKDGGSKSTSDFLYVYETAFHGFSARLTPEQALLLGKQPGVLGVIPDKIYHLQTTRSPHFLGLNTYHKPRGLLKESDLGSNVVIGILDSGIWPESPSFSDEGLGPVPVHFKGVCKGGIGFPSSLCNKKIVGARFFSDGIQAMAGSDEEEEQSARDTEGHGTHTASTAAGRAVNASFFGYAKGEATGIAPKARLSVYKVCWKNGCAGSDILAGLDYAVKDGVDVISLSLGSSPVTYSRDPIAIGTFAAMEKGIFVSAAAGNSGPAFESAANVAPWITTVGASSIDRYFHADLVLGNEVVLTGASLYTGKPWKGRQYFPIVDSGGSTCGTNSLDSSVKGKIVICARGGNSIVEKGLKVKEAGGVGVVVANNGNQGEGLKSDPLLIPGLVIPLSAKEKLVRYMNSSRSPTATIVFHGTKIGGGPAPVVAWFSSRGPHFESRYLLKPDIIAPGVDILAAWPDNVSPSGLGSSKDPRKSGFNIISGTSMSTPHVSGIAALLKGAHPDWSPAIIRSALMTTSYNQYRNAKRFLDQSNTEASIWATGAGHVDPVKADDPGLAYDLDVGAYTDFLCAHYTEDEIQGIAKRTVNCSMVGLKEWDLNYPAIVVFPGKDGGNRTQLTLTRTLTNVGDAVSRYSAIIVNPKGAKVTVDPLNLRFKAKAQKRSFSVKVSAVRNPSQDEEVGWLTWTDGKHNVTIPLVVNFMDE